MSSHLLHHKFPILVLQRCAHVNELHPGLDDALRVVSDLSVALCRMTDRVVSLQVAKEVIFVALKTAEEQRRAKRRMFATSRYSFVDRSG